MERVITIAGGGLAGLSLGIALRREGDPVILHEAGGYPRHRVCGEFISGASPDTFAMLGIGDLFQDAKKHRAMAWFFREKKILATQVPMGIGLSRFALDQGLSVKFQQLGGILRERSRLRPRQEEGVVWCAGRRPAKGRWIGLKCHVRGLDVEADLEMHLAANGYVGLARVEEDRINVCGLFRLEPELSGKGPQTLERYLRAGGLTSLAERVFAARLDEESFLGVAGFRLGRQRRGEVLALLGDAWGMIPPFTGNGMSMAFESAAIAVEPLHAWRVGRATWEKTVDKVQQQLATRFARRMFWARAMHPFLTTSVGQAVFAVLSRSGFLPFKFCFRALR